MIGLFKTEVIQRKGGGVHWRPSSSPRYWVDWFNHRRLLGPIGDIPPAEFETAFYAAQRDDQALVGIP